MSKADELRRFAEEALRWARQSKTEKEQRALKELARTYTQAAASLDLAANKHPPDPARTS
jgi:hypothetical protein